MVFKWFFKWFLNGRLLGSLIVASRSSMIILLGYLHTYFLQPSRPPVAKPEPLGVAEHEELERALRDGAAEDGGGHGVVALAAELPEGF